MMKVRPEYFRWPFERRERYGVIERACKPATQQLIKS